MYRNDYGGQKNYGGNFFIHKKLRIEMISLAVKEANLNRAVREGHRKMSLV